MLRIAKILGSILLASAMLSGCIPAAVLIGATAGGAIIYDKRSTKTILHDQQASETLDQRIQKDPALKNTHVVVATFNHVLLIVGQTPTTEQRQAVYQLATGIPHVSRIYNEITIEQPTSNWQRTHDSWITTKIKSELLTQPGMHSTEIKVVTENGVVYLMGVLSHKQADMAVSIARRVDGVKTVVKVFEYPQ